MKYNQSLVLICSLIAVQSACIKPKNSSPKDIVPFKVGDIEPKLGNGYDSLTQELRNTPSCVSGTASKLTSNGANIDLSQNSDSQKIAKEFSGEVKGTPKIAFLDAGAAAGFFRSLNKDTAAINIVYAVKVEAGGEKYNDVTLTDAAKALAPSALFNACGDEYVLQINRGGLLTITLSLDFASEANRQKWQTQLKLAGPWAEISSDITKKLEKNSIDGTLSVKVNQLGGTPSAALMAVHNCSMSTLEEFEICKQKVDEIMTYASSAFPTQIESNPAILNYVTSSLQTLGATSLPSLPEEILTIRQELAQLNQEYLGYNEGLAKAKAVGLEMDAKVAADIAANDALIKQAVKACYSYKVVGTDLDWSACKTQKKDLATKMKKIVPELASVMDATVPADSEIGTSIVNNFSTRMSITYSVVKQKSWNFDATDAVSFEGINTVSAKSTVSAKALSPTEKRGALLIRSNRSFQKIAASGKVDIGPGEALAFVMNDEVGKFSDNTGSQVVYWRCTNCTAAMKKLPTYRVRVRASEESGSAFVNQENLTGTYKISVYGSWGSSASWARTDAAGGIKTCGRKCPDPTSQFQTLVMKTPNSETATAIGREATLALTPSETLFFVMNDEANGYRDNYGEMEVILQCIKCDVSTHRVDIQASDAE